MESPGNPFKIEQPSRTESQVERDLNEIIPILAHGLVRRIEQKGFSGKVRVSAMAGDSWGVAKSSDNSTDIPNVIVYPREALTGDRRLTNARLRHEIGNLNYPIDGELNTLRDWCETHHVAPELLTSLVEAVHEASVNYLEMQNSHSDHPEENFRALYEQDINTKKIADTIGQSAPYKQAVDVALLYSLSQTGVIPQEQFELGLSNADPSVQEIFDKQTRSVLDQSVRMAVPKQQVQLIRDFLWPKFSKLVAPSTQAVQRSVEAKQEPSPAQAQLQEIQERMQKVMEKIRQQAKPKEKAAARSDQKQGQKKPPSESKLPQQKELSPDEQREQKEAKDLLAENLKERLEDLKKQFEDLQGRQEEAKPAKPEKEASSLQEVAKQADQMQKQVEKAQQAKEKGSEEEKATAEQLQALKEQLEQLEELAKEIAETDFEKEEAKAEEEPIDFNITEYGIDEGKLAPEQLEMLSKIREFAQHTSRVYRTAMRFVMSGYQRRNPNFTDSMMQRMKDRKYDLPAFAIYGVEAAREFLSERGELGLDPSELNNLIVNFNLPRPLGRFWYKGGEGSRSQPVREGEIEWGHFYRMGMPAIYSGVDRAMMKGLHLNRLNSFGQHDPKKYYYLWEAIGQQLEENQSDESEESPGGGEPGQGEGGAGEPGGGEPGGGEAGGGMPSAGEMKEMMEQMQEMLSQAKGQGGQPGGAPGAGQEAIQHMMDQLAQMQEALQAGASPQEMAGQMQDAIEKMGEMMGKGQRGPGESSPSTDKLSGGQSDEQGFKKSKIENEASPSDSQHQGGAGNTVEGEGMTFARPDPNLLKQLRNMETSIGSKFAAQDDQGKFVPKDVTAELPKLSQQQVADIERKQAEQLQNLDSLKREQQAKMEALYKEMSGLDGEALRVYVGYMESMKDLTEDLTDFFIEKFQLDKDYVYARNQRRGARLQRGYTKNILGTKGGKPVINPRSFERKNVPEMPQFVWTIVLDNTGSVGGMIEDEKKLAIALMEVTKRLDIPFEMVIYTEGGYQFLKTFDQEAFGEDLQKIVLLQATIGNQQDTDLLRAAYASQTRQAGQFKRAHNFIFFLTDGLACSADSLHDLVQKFKKETVILGVGLAQGAGTIKKEFGKNALEVPDAKQLSSKFIHKLEDLIDQTFD
jgi:hypothetical protein